MLDAAIAGLVAGAAYAVLGACLVVMYRMVAVLNVAQAALGALGTYVMLRSFDAGMPYVAAAVAGIVVAACAAGGLGAVIAGIFGDATLELRSTAVIAITVGLFAVGFRLQGPHPFTIPAAFPGASLLLGGVVVPVSAALLAAVALTLAGAAGLFLGCARLGIQLRALAQRPSTAALLGIPVRRLTVGVWAITGAISALTVQLVAPTRTSDFLSLSLLVIPALAAALLGAFRSLALTVAAGFGIGALEGVATRWDSIGPYRQVLPFLLIVVTLLWSQRREVWDAAR